MIEPRRQLRNAIVGLCAVFAAGCHTSKNVNLVENPDTTSRPSRIEVVTKSGSAIRVYAPVIERDSLRGYLDEERTNATVLAVSDIQSARSRQVSSGRTAALVVAIVAAAVGTLFVLAIIALSQGDF